MPEHVFQISLKDLSPLSRTPEDHLLVALKSFFDGGNQADSREYDIVTLAAFSGSSIQWDNFDEQWGQNLIKHHAVWLHTTDAAILSGPFSKNKGWTTAKVDAFINDCVTIIERCSTVRVGTELTHFGIRPATVSVLLKDYKRALLKVANIESPTEICAIQCVRSCFDYGNYKNQILKEQQKFQLFFDRGEPFFGHINDRLSNKLSRRADPGLKNVTHIGTSNMRDVPALQTSDLLAWSVNHKHKEGITREWQERVLEIDRDPEWFDYSRLIEPDLVSLGRIRSWKLPRRKPFQ